MAGVANTTKKAFSDTVGQTKTLFTHPSKLNGGQVLNVFSAGGMSPLQQGYSSFSKGGSAPGQAGYTDNPAQTLAQTGGAPLLANIALGANVQDAVASYFGASDYDSWHKSLSPDDQQLVDGVTKQLTEIQTNTNMRNQAVQSVINDFPNIASQASQARLASGDEFDSVTKGYIDQALNSTAAKYAAGGNLSSGAMDAATARVGAENGMNKLNYMDQRGQTAYDQGLQGWQARYNEVNALRSFQNTMTQGAAGPGFSAVQAALNRTQQTNMVNAGFGNDLTKQNNQDQTNMFGAIGGLAGTTIGAIYGGPAGAAVGGTAGKMAGSAIGGAVNSNNAPSQAGAPSYSNWG